MWVPPPKELSPNLGDGLKDQAAVWARSIGLDYCAPQEGATKRTANCPHVRVLGDGRLHQVATKIVQRRAASSLRR